MDPIDTRRRGTAVRAYSGELGWPLTVGYRYRPRQGCTCGAANCPVPGAHPVPGRPSFRPQSEVASELENTPGAGLIAWTALFDAVVVPRTVGMVAMVALDRIAPVPCLTYDDRAVLLVLPSTGRYALAEDMEGEVKSGPEEWIALPPSHGVRWDTMPWVEGTLKPIQLLHGNDIGRHMRRAVMAQGGVGMLS